MQQSHKKYIGFPRMSSLLHRLGLIITYRCNAECCHCFFESGPNREERMDLKLGLKAINEAARLGVEWISFTGGEPFLELNLLEELVDYSTYIGMKTEVVSNGYWAKTPAIAAQVLESLRKRGLDVLNLSIDDFHQEQVPINNVRNAYNTALKLGIKIVIMTTTTKNNKITITDNGCGIKRKHRKHIFKPGYSTKSVGEGHGLALAQKAIQELNGSIIIKPRIKGTKTVINLK